MRKLVTALIVSCIGIFLITAAASADVSKKDIEKSFKGKTFTHPYLFFTEEEKPAILERIRTDQECGDIMKRYLAEANRLLYTPVEYQAPLEDKNTRFDRSADTYGRYYSENLNRAHHLAFVYQMTGEDTYAQKAFEFAECICDLKSWTRRAHEFPIIYSRVWPWNANNDDDQVMFSFDHYNGDTASEMATIYDWLYPALNKRQRDRIRGALLEKAITRVRGNYEYHWWASSYKCNWCSVCNSGLGLAALALVNENPQILDVAAESYNRISRLLDEIGEDGGWQEGVGYWNYALRTTQFYADALKRMTGGKYNLFEHPGISEETVNFPLYCLIAPHQSLPFEDSGEHRNIGSSYFYNKMAAETGSGESVWYRNHMFGAGTNMFDIIWPRSTVAPSLPDETSIHFKTIDWFVFRNSFDRNDQVMVAGKAGFNDDPHHGHLDIGNFVIYWHKTPYISEIERMSYDEKYFDELRWDYVAAASIGHNVVHVNGERQIPAKLKDQPWKDGIGGRILDSRTAGSRNYVLMDPTNAYPKQELKKWRRHIILEKPDITVVLDEVTCDRGDEIAVRFHSEVEQLDMDDHLLLKGDSGTMALIPAVNGEYDLVSGRHGILPVIKNARFRWVPYVDTVVNAPAENNDIVTVILPVDSDRDASSVAKSVQLDSSSDGLTVSFAADGQSYMYTFENTKDGLVLSGE